MKNFFEGNCIKIIFLALIMMFLMPTQVQAITNMRQTAATDSTASIAWTADPGEAYYEIEVETATYYWEGNTHKSDYHWVNLGKTTGTSFVLTGLNGGMYHEFSITAYDANGDWLQSETYNKLFTLPGKVDVFGHKFQWGYAVNHIPVNYNLMISFVGQETAQGYQVKLMNSKGKKLKTKKVKETGNVFYFPQFMQLKKQVYCIQVRAYTTYDNKKVYGTWGDKIYVLPSPQCRARYKNGKVEIAWSKIKGATGYDIYMGTKKKGNYKKVASVSKNKSSVKIKKYGNAKFKKNKTYYYYVIAKKASGGKTYCSEITYRYKMKTGR